MRLRVTSSGSSPRPPPILVQHVLRLARRGWQRRSRDATRRILGRTEPSSSHRTRLPNRPRPVTNAAKQPRPPEWRIRQHRDLAITCQRQDGILDLAIINCVVDADEIERLGFHDFDQIVVLLRQRRSNADVAYAPLLSLPRILSA